MGIIMHKGVAYGGGIGAISEASDVALTTPTDGQILKYDTSGQTPEWVNASLGDLASINKDGVSSTKYLRGDGTWQTFPTIPTVNNGTLTVKQNNTSKGTFTANQSGNTTVELTDTTYESKTASSGGTAVSLVTTGEKYTWNSKSDFDGAYSSLSGKPTLGTAAAKDVPTSGNASSSQVVMGNDSRLTDSRNAADVYSWAKASTKPTYTASEVGALPISGGTMTDTIVTPSDSSKGIEPASAFGGYIGSASKPYYSMGTGELGIFNVTASPSLIRSDILGDTLTANRTLFVPDESGTLATREYIKNTIGVFTSATWKASSSNAVGTKLTNDITLSKGKYIITAQSCGISISSANAPATLTASSGTIVKANNNDNMLLGLYNHFLTSIEVTSNSATMALTTGFSASCTYSYTDRGFIRAIRIA